MQHRQPANEIWNLVKIKVCDVFMKVFLTSGRLKTFSCIFDVKFNESRKCLEKKNPQRKHANLFSFLSSFYFLMLIFTLLFHFISKDKNTLLLLHTHTDTEYCVPLPDRWIRWRCTVEPRGWTSSSSSSSALFLYRWWWTLGPRLSRAHGEPGNTQTRLLHMWVCLSGLFFFYITTWCYK